MKLFLLDNFFSIKLFFFFFGFSIKLTNLEVSCDVSDGRVFESIGIDQVCSMQGVDDVILVQVLWQLVQALGHQALDVVFVTDLEQAEKGRL